MVSGQRANVTCCCIHRATFGGFEGLWNYLLDMSVNGGVNILMC